MPSVGGIGASAVALHEILALAFDRRDKGTVGRNEIPNATVAASLERPESEADFS
jgi:hypothetical protein